MMGRRGNGTRQRQDGTQTCKATCEPNAGEGELWPVQDGERGRGGAWQSRESTQTLQ